MSESDDIEKLLREIDAMNASKGASPAGGSGKAVDPAAKALPAAHSQSGGRVAWAGATAAGGLVVGGIVGTVLTWLPSMGTLSTAIGAALGAAVAGFVSGPPEWFDRG